MTHADPAAGGKSAPGFITIGEIMLRLTPPDYDKMQTAILLHRRRGGHPGSDESELQHPALKRLF